MTHRIVWIATVAIGVMLSSDCRAGQILYGGNGNGSASPGGFVTIDQTTGVGTFIGDPVTPGGLTGIDFSSTGVLYGSTIRTVGGVGTSQLVTIDPATGGLLTTIGPILDVTGAAIGIGDLAFQPGTGTLFGIRSNAAGGGGLLYTINLTTAVATLVGNTGGGAGGGIAFAPDGTLYQTGFSSNFDFTSLNTINPADASRINTVPIGSYLDGLAVRADGTLFAVQGGSNDTIFTLNSVTGDLTLVGSTGTGSPSDLAFAPVVPEPGSLALLVTGALGLVVARRRKA